VGLTRETPLDIYDPFSLAAGVVFLAWVANYISYRWIKEKTLAERRWDYNISCGTTDGGGINADIARHGDIPNFEMVTDIYALPHADGVFDQVISSHTIEHVDDPERFYAELKRIGKSVTLLVPPIWDFSAALNCFEHRVIFLTVFSRHDNKLPPFVRYMPARWIQDRIGQRIEADQRASHAPMAGRWMLDILIPVAFFGSAFLLLLDHWLGFVIGVVGALALSASKKHQPAGTSAA
jgi:SAM-dependent methyltransferase